MDQGSTMKRSAVHNFAPTVTKFCVMWEGQALPHDTKFGNSRCEIVGRRVIFIWSLIHGLRWSGLIKAEPKEHVLQDYFTGTVAIESTYNHNINTTEQSTAKQGIKLRVSYNARVFAAQKTNKAGKLHKRWLDRKTNGAPGLVTIITWQWRHNERDGVSNHQSHDCLLNRLFRRRTKKASKLRVTGLCEGNSPVTGEFPPQRASNAENVSIWWRHHESQVPGTHLNIWYP